MVVDVGYIKRVSKRLFTLFLTLIGIYLAFKMAVFYMPFLIAFIIAIMVEPLIKIISKKTKLERKPCAIIVLAIVFAIIVGLLIWGIGAIIDEGMSLLKMLNNYVGDGYRLYNELNR